MRIRPRRSIWPIFEGAGLLRREPDPAHGRILRSGLTPEGERIVKKVHKAVAGMEAQLTSLLGAAEAHRMAAQLRGCAEVLASELKDHRR